MKERILKILQNENEDIREDSELLSGGFIDSVVIVNLIVELEEEFDIEFNIDEVVAKNFKNLEAIEALVKATMEHKAV